MLYIILVPDQAEINHRACRQGTLPARCENFGVDSFDHAVRLGWFPRSLLVRHQGRPGWPPCGRFASRM